MNKELKTMNNELKKSGFSLTEILLAVATLGIGMLFIAGTFLTGIHFSTIATEQTTAAVAADEAFAKIRLYGVNPSNLEVEQLKTYEPQKTMDPNEFAYPSTDTDVLQKQYFWSALCRRVGSNTNSRLVQITVFVSRKVGSGTRYRVRNPDGTLNPAGGSYPIPIAVRVAGVVGSKELKIQNLGEKTFINDGYTIVDNKTGQICRVVERTADRPDVIRLYQTWQGSPAGSVWVVPPPIGGGKNPTIAIYQKVMRF